MAILLFSKTMYYFGILLIEDNIIICCANRHTKLGETKSVQVLLPDGLAFCKSQPVWKDKVHSTFSYKTSCKYL